MIIARQTAPLLCFDEELKEKFDESICRIMMGYAMRHQRLLPPEKMVNVFIHNAEETYQYMGYYKDLRIADSKVEVAPLGKDYNVAVQKHRKLTTGNDREYTTGIIGHTARHGWWDLKSNYTGNQKDLDIYELLSEFVQEEYAQWVNPCTDEASCGFVTQKAYDAELNERLTSIVKAYTGKRERLYRTYSFKGVMYDKSTNSTTLFFNQAHYDLGHIYRSFVQSVKSSVLRPPTDRGDFFSWMLISKETGPMYCSENADFTKSDEC